jgi:hypothetical protein
LSRNRKYSLRLVERDLELFKYLFYLKGATRHQINRDIFGGVSKYVLHDRLFKLSQYGYIIRGLCDFGPSRTFFYLSKKSLQVLDLFDSEVERRELKSGSPYHDFFLVDVRAKFLSAQGHIQYLTENQLQSMAFNDLGFNYQCYRELHSDAFLRIKIGKGEFSGAIEYEQSTKRRRRYESLFSRYYATEDVAFVFYICRSLAFQENLMRIEKDIRGNKDSKFFFIAEDDFLKSSSAITLINPESLRIDIRLNELAKEVHNK